MNVNATRTRHQLQTGIREKSSKMCRRALSRFERTVDRLRPRQVRKIWGKAVAAAKLGGKSLSDHATQVHDRAKTLQRAGQQ